MRLLHFVVSLIIMSFSFASNYPKCVGVYYAENPPLEMFYAFDWIVLDPDAAKETLTKKRLMFEGKRAKLFGYISVGEIEPFREEFKQVKKEWIIGENKYWKSYVADVRNPEYHEFILRKADKVAKLGFDGFFLDTLDSYQIVAKKHEYAEFESGLKAIIRKLKEKYPEKKIILNRGFEIYQNVKDSIDAVLVESFYHKFDLEKKRYVPTTTQDREYLYNLISKINQEKPVIVVDYMDLPKQTKEAKSLLKQISSLGMIPFVSVKDLNVIGISPCTPKPRKALGIFNSKDYKDAEDPYFNNINQLVQPYLEYYGISVDIWDISKGLPPFPMWDRYGLVVYWASTSSVNIRDLENWILENVSHGVKFLFIDNLPSYKPDFLKRLGITLKNTSQSSWMLDYKSEMMNFEIEAKPEFDPIVHISEGVPMLIYTNGSSRYVPIAFTPWGGYALSGTYVRYIIENFFVVNPFLFFKELVKDIKPFAVADPITTENGRRILTVHIDGDGFNQKTQVKGYTYASEVILEEMLKKYRLPTTLGIIEGEVAPHGAYPNDQHKLLEEIVKKTFSLPYVEPATHTFSHPFNYYKVSEQGEEHKGYNLKIPGYKYNFEREILGSVLYVDKLAFPKKTQIVFWTGYCNPTPEEVKFVYEKGFYNINGGNTWIHSEHPFLSLLSPTGVDKEGYYQVYAPVINENVYTQGGLLQYRYANVVKTFQITDKPYRIKPIGIYYHIFSGSTNMFLNALKKVYDWVITQETVPLHTLEYIKKVLDFRVSTFIPLEDGSLMVRNGGFLRTLRIDEDIYIDLVKSKGVVGYKNINGSTYLHLDGSGDYLIVKGKSDAPYVVDANGVVKSYTREGKDIELTIDSHLSLEATFYVPSGCNMKTNGKVNLVENLYKVKFNENIGKISIVCK